MNALHSWKTCYLFGLLLTVPSVFAQELEFIVEEATIETDGTGGQPLVISSEAISVGDGQGEVFMFATDGVSSDGGLSLSLPMSMGLGGGIPTDALQMLQMQQFENEMELVDDQIKQLRELRREVGQMNQAVAKKFRPTPGQPRPDFQALQAEMTDIQAAIKQKTEEGLKQILLPHQLRRLEQVQTQLSFRNQGVSALASERIADSLELTEDQRNALKDKQTEYQDRLREEIEKLKSQLRDEIVGEILTPTQAQKLQDLVGEKYEVKKPNRRSLFQRNSEDASSSIDRQEAK